MLGVFTANAYDTGQKILKPEVRTLAVVNPDNFMAPPVIRLGSHDRLNFNFDLIGDQHQYLRFRLIHCNADWQPSRLLESEVLRGFNEFEIEDYAYSENTYIHYINYNISFPDPRVEILASGNYLLQVFPESDPSDILLQARFSVSDERAIVRGGVTPKTDKGINSDFQQVFFEIDLSSLGDINPYQDLIVTVTQNNNPGSTRSVSHPLRVDRGRAVFEHSQDLIFEAGNEFRRFETVRTDYPGMHVDSVKYKNGLWHAWLKPDFSRKNKEYQFDQTQNGRFKIDEYNSTDPDLGADYVMVHFLLDPDDHIAGEIFLDGDFTNHELSDQYRMRYDWNKGTYEIAIPLKQGSYNYQYIVKPERGAPSSKNIEGNKYETRNEYEIKVFLRPPGSRGDRLISTQILYP